MHVQFRPSQPEDAEAIAFIQRDTWRATYPSQERGITQKDIDDYTDSFVTDEKIASLRDRIKEGGSVSLVAEVDGKIVGFAVGIPEDNHNNFKAIYILPEYQGKGIGVGLYHELLKNFDERDIYVEVADYNESAIRFYEKLDFKKVKPGDEQREFPSGGVLTTIIMKLKRR